MGIVSRETWLIAEPFHVKRLRIESDREHDIARAKRRGCVAQLVPAVAPAAANAYAKFLAVRCADG